MKVNRKLEEATGTITELQSNSFSICNTPEMIEILSKQMYEHPLQAVARELICNAIDAHKACGQTCKVEVQMPNSLINGNSFVVKDFGVGLSKDEVFSLYTSYGASTKRDSNDFIGCLGIGSKSPFAVTESFSVSSRYNGTETLYHCYKQKGIPVCTEVSSVPTTEHNGLTISVPIPDDRSFEFKKECDRVFLGFSKELVSVPNRDIDFFEDIKVTNKYTGEMEGATLYCTKLDLNSRILVRMGQVLYTTNFATGYSAHTAILEVPIGTFSISASRESLEASEENLSIFRGIIRGMYRTFLSSASEEIGHIKTLSGAGRLHERWCDLCCDLEYKGRREDKVLEGILDKYNKTIELLPTNSLQEMAANGNCTMFDKAEEVRRKSTYSHSSVTVYSYLTDSCCVVINDIALEEEKARKVCRKYFRRFFNPKKYCSSIDYVLLSPTERRKIPAFAFPHTYFLSDIHRVIKSIKVSARKDLTKKVKSPTISATVLCDGEPTTREVISDWTGLYVVAYKGTLAGREVDKVNAMQRMLGSKKGVMLVPKTKVRFLNPAAKELETEFKNNEKKVRSYLWSSWRVMKKSFTDDFKILPSLRDKFNRAFKATMNTKSRPREFSTSDVFNLELRLFCDYFNYECLLNSFNTLLKIQEDTEEFKGKLSNRFSGICLYKTKQIPENIWESVSRIYLDDVLSKAATESAVTN